MNFKKIRKERMLEIINDIETKRLEKCTICNEKVLQLQNKRQVVCKNIACPNKGKKISVWASTIFSKTKLSKYKVLRIIELFMIKTPRDIIAYELCLNKKTVWRILKHVSRIVVPSYYNSMDELGGDSQIIEIDESKFGKRKYNRGHKVEGIWILGMVEKGGSKRIKLVQVDERTLSTLTNHITSSVNNKSIIYTDGWKGYNAIKDNFTEHCSVNHSKHYKDPETGVHTNTIEGCWSGIKMHIPPRGRTKDKINFYLARYMLIKNEKQHPFEAIIKYLF
jgi:transposase-like protein